MKCEMCSVECEVRGMGFDGDKKSHRHPERQRRIQGRRCEISYKVCKACHPGLEPVPDLFRDAGVIFLTLRAIPTSAGMTSGNSEVYVRVGDCIRKQNSKEAIATSWGSAMKMHKCIFTALALQTFHVKHFFIHKKFTFIKNLFTDIFKK